MARPPDFFLIGAPKAGTSALHAALAGHPGLHLSPVKEPKYYLCGDSPPPAYKGPGDTHSNQEWIWQRGRYLDLFEGAACGVPRGESTPFYLYHRTPGAGSPPTTPQRGSWPCSGTPEATPRPRVTR